MKYLKKKKKSKALPVLVAAVLLAAAAAVVYLLNPGGVLDGLMPAPVQTGELTQGATEAPTQSATDPVQTQPQQSQDEGIAIETPYGAIHYPRQFGPYLHVNVREDGGCILEFCARFEGREDLPLFDLALGGGSPAPIGMMKTAGGDTVPVGLKTYDLTACEGWSDEEMATAMAMQEALNEVLAALDLGPVETEAADLEIGTPCGTLVYPGVWRDYLQVEHLEGDPYTVEFYGKLLGREKQLLFSVICGGPEAGAVAMAGGTVPVHVSVSELIFDDSWTEAETDILYAMQESMNDLIDSMQME